MTITIDELLVSPFLSRTLEEKLKIVSEGKPRPSLNMAAVVTMNNSNAGDDSKLCTYQFNPDMYDEIEWLTGCDKRHTFYCWPCLLFMPAVGMWNTSGIADLVYFMEGKSRHEETFEHMQATLKTQEMIELNTKMSSTDASEHNEIVRRNRAILKRVTDVVCNLLTKEQPSHERINGCELDPENCVRNLQFLRPYDVLNCNYIEDAIDLIRISPNIVHDLVLTLTKGMKMAIRKEIQQSTYASVILTDHSVIAEKSQISTVIRYLKGGSVCEKFIGYSNLGDQNIIYQHILNVLNEFALPERFLALAVDGGILKTADMVELVHTLKNVYPYTFFVPWYGHGVDYVLQQSLANMSECCSFFKVMDEMKIYFQKKSRRFKSLETWMATNVPSTKNSKWFPRSQFVQVVNTHRKHFVQFFDSVVQSSAMWEPDDISKATGFAEILEDFHTIFLLETVSRLFEHTAALNKILRGASSERIFSSEEPNFLKSKLAIARDGGFEDLWSDVLLKRLKEQPGPPVKKVKVDADDPKTKEYRELYVSIVNRLLTEVDLRFANLSSLCFCQLLSCDRQGKFIFSNDMIEALVAVHGAYFDEEQIRNELIVLRTNGTVFGKKSVYEILDFLAQAKLKGTFKYLFKLAEFILTLPVKPPDEAASTSKFKDIKEWSYVPEKPTVSVGDVSVPCVELEFLQELKKSSTFHDEIAVIFYELNKTFELLHR